MQHDPKIVFGDIQHSANLLAVDLVELPQAERCANVLGQFAGAIVKSLPKRLVIQAAARIGRPFHWPQLVNPGAFSRTFSYEPLTFFVLIELEIGERCFTAGLAIEVTDLVLHDAHEPSLLCRSPREALGPFQSRQERFLNNILRFGGVAQTQQSVLEQVIPVLLDPALGIGKPARICRSRIPNRWLGASRFFL